jgi:hypothetical protein
VVRAGAHVCEAADAAGHRVPGRRARAREAARVGAACAALEEVPPRGDPRVSRVLGDAAVPAPLGDDRCVNPRIIFTPFHAPYPSKIAQIE